MPFLLLSCAASWLPSPPSFVWVVPVLVFCPAPAALPSLLLAASPSLCLWCCVCLGVLLTFRCLSTMSPLFSPTGLLLGSAASLLNLFWIFVSGAAVSLPSFRGCYPPSLFVCLLAVCVSVWWLVLLSFFLWFVWFGEVGP